MNLPLIIAHRGASFLAPENTLSAVKLAWTLGAEAVEIDIRLTRDQHIVVSHDANTWRLTHHFGYIGRHSLKQLQKLDFGRHKGSQWRGEKITTLNAVLDSLPNSRKLFIEIKGKPFIVPFIDRALTSYAFNDGEINFLAFNYQTAIAAKKSFPDKAVYMLYEFGFKKPGADYFTKKILAANLDGLDISDSSAIDRSFVETIQTAGKKLVVWTVDDHREARRLADLGVDGITSDRPAWLKKKLQEID